MPNARVNWGLRFGATSYGLRINYNSAGAQTVTIPVSRARDYWMAGDGQADSSAGAGDLLRVLELAIETYSFAVIAATVTLDTNFRVNIATGGNLQILWADAATTIDPTIFGWTAANVGPSASLTSPNLPQGIWRPQRPVGVDSRDRQPVVGGVLSAISGLQEVSRVALPYRTRDLGFAQLAPDRVLAEYSSASEPTGSFESLWLNAATLNYGLRVYEDETSRSSTGYRQYKTRSIADPIVRNGQFQYWFDVNLQLQRDS